MVTSAINASDCEGENELKDTPQIVKLLNKLKCLQDKLVVAEAHANRWKRIASDTSDSNCTKWFHEYVDARLALQNEIIDLNVLIDQERSKLIAASSI